MKYTYRFMAIDKQPGVHPIANGEMSRRVIRKAILSTVTSDVMEVTSSIQLYTDLESGCEAAAHAMQAILQD